MSNPRAIALPPDRVQIGTDQPSRLNLFLYQITHNEALGNDRLPVRNGDRTLVNIPQPALSWWPVVSNSLRSLRMRKRRCRYSPPPSRKISAGPPCRCACVSMAWTACSSTAAPTRPSAARSAE